MIFILKKKNKKLKKIYVKNFIKNGRMQRLYNKHIYIFELD